MAIVSILMSVGTIIMYFFLSLFIPFLTYLIPKYKITKVNLYKKKYSLAINILVALILFCISPEYLLIYLIFPYAMEFMFYLFNKIAKRMQVFNRIVLMSIVPSILISFYLYFNMDRINYIATNLPRMTNIVEQVGIENISVLQESMVLVSSYYIFGAFFVVLLANFFLFLTLIPSTYKLWKISCYWIIPYMLILWAHKYNISVNILFENNILEIIKWIYVLYGIKVIYNLTDRIGVKSNILKHGVSMLLGLSYPMVAFIIGALASFEFIEVKEIRM
ncbi:hypothetical protein LDK18_00580 [Fusobacterium nucleatum subsp. nucleatum ATCC 23726]|uniref:Uncharacterized protein n=1 Tax=Fusobacterium nucleatum subsp. nucleatum (strain ATCC 23726 / VPI 4351) TaxID=525283 RepID=D5RCU8_FUSN2|nr:hypothetical protein [Fusobacterium nucleatum]AVQ22824.1 hypothetical protein C4N14_03920 [Fusobacterium nucleatum subsp. nucleatum ATCC 23726]EFG95403.1 hypothetical protein HMPREF0397_1033 [Fusobacterium nucleatum subsp. nucleatum ATCC 23726]